MNDINLLKNAGYDVDNASEQLGGLEMYNEILNDFYNESIDRVKKIMEYKKNDDLKNYAIEVHAMKSECMYLGINVLANMCLDHQLKSEANDVEFINSHFEELMSEIAKVLTVIKQYFGK